MRPRSALPHPTADPPPHTQLATLQPTANGLARAQAATPCVAAPQRFCHSIPGKRIVPCRGVRIPQQHSRLRIAFGGSRCPEL